MMSRALLLVLTISLVGTACDGVGRPLVRPLDHPDGGEPNNCEAAPRCQPLRSVDASHFDVPTDAPPLQDMDCDGDLIDDAIDNCVGVPNPTQGLRDCDRARTDCGRLSSGDLNLDNADLRGCRIASPILLGGSMSLRGASLSCADFALVGQSDTTVDITDATVTSSRMSVSGERPVAVNLGRTTLFRSSLTISGAARVHASSAIFEESAIFVHPNGGAVAGLPAPAFDVSEANFSRTTLYESAASRSGRIRIDRSAIANARFNVRELDLYESTVSASRIAAEELDAFEVEIRSSEVRTRRGAFASAHMSEVVFADCHSLRISNTDASGVDIPACPPLGLRVFRSELDGCSLAGGVELEESIFMAGTLGGGPDSTLTSRDSELDGVRFCDLGAGAFIGGEIRCGHCADDAFAGGERVCVSGTRLVERGCPAIELARTCE